VQNSTIASGTFDAKGYYTFSAGDLSLDSGKMLVVKAASFIAPIEYTASSLTAVAGESYFRIMAAVGRM
jgi:hypothetical protein